MKIDYSKYLSTRDSWTWIPSYCIRDTLGKTFVALKKRIMGIPEPMSDPKSSGEMEPYFVCMRLVVEMGSTPPKKETGEPTCCGKTFRVHEYPGLKVADTCPECGKGLLSYVDPRAIYGSKP